MKHAPPPLTFRQMMDVAKSEIYNAMEAGRPLMEGYNPNPQIPPRRQWKMGKLLRKRLGDDDALLRQFLDERKGPGSGQKFLDRWEKLDKQYGIDASETPLAEGGR